ncbi:hypothetical protein QYE76_008131 [Lolium multiflorum]|uniref:Uncharacterized protein n=1 Tax=Lolium multiflorum TaxID=4521 RepID=A0AAD8VC80_LOLMU|nr:hypothetical protein QYE76_008131 [Lolium multiflorum]
MTSARGLVHISPFTFDGTNYDAWKFYMLDYFRDMHPHVERILDMGFSPPKDPQNPTFEEKKNSYLDAQATKVLCRVVSHVVISSIAPFRSAHEVWTKLRDTYGGSKTIEDDHAPSTSPTCGKTQGNGMVSGDEHCIVDGERSLDDSSSLPHCNVSSLDFNTCSTINDLHASVDSPCISSSHDDMLLLSCCHNEDTLLSSSICANNVEETKDTMGQDKILDGASRNSSSSSLHGSYTCLMAKASKVSPSLEPYLSSDDEDDDMEGLNVASLNKLGESVYHALPKKKLARSNFKKIFNFAIKSTKLIEKKEEYEREDAIEIATLKEALKEQQTTNETLEENFALKIRRVKESRDRALEVAHDLQIKYDELVIVHGKLLEDCELLTESLEQFEALNQIELAKLPSPCAIIDNACASNSTSCEASILKENVELRAQLALLTSNYEKLEESHGKLSSSHDDLLVSHDLLKLAHEAIMTKLEAQVTSFKKNLVKGHEGKKFPNDKSGLGFNSNNKNKSTSHKRKKGQGHVKDPAKIVCFKCKIEGHHVRLCPLKKKPLGEKKQGKRPQDGVHGLPQGQAQGLPQREEGPLPEKDQAKAPVAEKSSCKMEKMEYNDEDGVEERRGRCRRRREKTACMMKEDGGTYNHEGKENCTWAGRYYRGRYRAKYRTRDFLYWTRSGTRPVPARYYRTSYRTRPGTKAGTTALAQLASTRLGPCRPTTPLARAPRLPLRSPGRSLARRQHLSRPRLDTPRVDHAGEALIPAPFRCARERTCSLLHAAAPPAPSSHNAAVCSCHAACGSAAASPAATRHAAAPHCRMHAAVPSLFAYDRAAVIPLDKR